MCSLESVQTYGFELVPEVFHGQRVERTLEERPLIVHASSKSHNERPRRVLHIEYAASEFIASPLRLALG